MPKNEIPKNFKDLLQTAKSNKSLPEIPKEKGTFGERAADRVTGFAGSWKFIIILIAIIVAWITLNVVGIFLVWDPWPFIMLNLVLSCIAAMQAPIILMSQNRQAERDRLSQRYDYLVDRKTSRDVQEIAKQLNSIKYKLDKLDEKTPNTNRKFR
jgi:uncharacterized membrane protein